MKTHRTDLRNIAIIAHVDHGKTTLVDGLLKQARVFRENQQVAERVMDSNDLERERGITILAKNTAVQIWDAQADQQVKINIVDTPGHADFGGEVERVMNMVDGVLLLVDAAEGPMPQTRFVLRKAMEMGHKAIVVVNKVDRKDAEPQRVLNETFDLFIELGASDEQAEFPVVYTNAITGQAGLTPDLGPDLQPLFQAILRHIPPPRGRSGSPAAAAGHQPGLRRLPRRDRRSGGVFAGRITGRAAACPDDPGRPGAARAGPLPVRPPGAGARRSRGGRGRRDRRPGRAGRDRHRRNPGRSGKPGRPAADPGRRADRADDLRRQHLALLWAGRALGHLSQAARAPVRRAAHQRRPARRRDRDGRYLPGLRARRAAPGDPDRDHAPRGLRVPGLAPGSHPEERRRRRDRSSRSKKLHIETHPDTVGVVVEMLGGRRGQMIDMVETGDGSTHLTYIVPTRGLLGFRYQFLTATRGMGVMNTIFHGYLPMAGPISGRERGSLVAWETGVTTTYGLHNAEERGILFIGPGMEVYEGMVIGENAKPGDIAVNVCKTKHLTNMRAARADITVRLTPPRQMSLDEAIEYLAEDELLEVTPENYRIRKRILNTEERGKLTKKAKEALEAV